MAKKRSVKKQSRKRLSATDRARILAEAKAKGWTADQIAKTYGVSKWTVYGWRQSRSKPGGVPATGPRGNQRPSGASSLAEMLRPLIAELVREELRRLVGVR